MTLPHKTVKDMMRKFGVERTQPEAVDMLIKHLEKRIREATEEARKYMEHAGRKTVQKIDMELALSVLERR